MSIAELRKLSRVEKLRVIEALWEDLARDEESLSSPDWHEGELRETEARFNAGKVEVLGWDEAKKQLLQRFE